MLKFLFSFLLFMTSLFPDLTIDGNGATFELNDTSSLWVGSNKTLTLKNLTLSGLSGERLVMENPDSILVLRDSTIILDGNYSFTQGAIIFQSMVEFAGTYTFQYTSNMTSTIAANSMLKFDVRSIFNYAPTSAKRKNDVRTLFEFTDFTSKLFLNGSTLSVTDTGMYLNGGVIVVDHNSKIVADGTTISDGVVFGDNLDIVKTTSFIIYPAGKIIANNVNNLSQYVTLLTP